MKVRTITIGIEVNSNDFIELDGIYPLAQKLKLAKNSLKSIDLSLTSSGYEVQTQRISFNSLEEWLIDSNKDIAYHINIIEILVQLLTLNSIEFCSIGCCSSLFAISILPQILAKSEKLYCSVLFKKTDIDHISPDLAFIKKTSETLLKIANEIGVSGCFRICASFNCSSGIPFFPAAYYEENISPKDNDRHKGYIVSLGLECADLLFIGFFGAESVSEGSRNLSDVLKQALLPIQNIVSTACDVLKLEYGGIDASINPGLSLADSVGAGLENLLFLPQKTTSSLPPLPVQKFGEFGTLAAVSAVTNAVKSLANNGIKLIGYNGLMLPVMEDLILAERAAEIPSTVTLRDLLMFSSVCGVGLDTVPVPGDITEESISRIYLETAALAFRLNKPLSCRLLIMTNQKSGDMTEISNPYLCNTRVFKV
mmetsp:Transcript_28751/g.27542  ORF Transcript_28751/g.27542 Transcript_28751/m.27542 type:complete len:425 (+) Transcript_28751:55-1329(+)